MNINTLNHFSKYLFCTAISLLLLTAGCSGESGSNKDNKESVENTNSNSELTNSNRESNQSEPAETLDTPEPSADKAPGPYIYTRDETYPNVVRLPLTYFVSSTGKKIGVKATLPADESGKPIDGVFPTILVQTAYNMSLLSFLQPMGALLAGPDPYFVKRGYAMVSVDVYGTGVSEGGWELISEEEQEAYAEAVDWVLQQPWSNSKVATSGTSYMGISALVAAQRRPDAVKAVFAVNPMGDAQRGTVNIGGLVNGLFMERWMTITQTLGTQNVLAGLLNPSHMNQIMSSTREHVAHIDNYYIPLINDALEGADYIRYDGDFWRTRSPLEGMDKIKAPTFVTGALYDIFQRDEPLIYETLKNNNVDARLAIFEGSHISSLTMNMAFNDTLPNFNHLILQWFDKHVMGIDSGIENIPEVTQYVKNYRPKSGDYFITTTDWPHPLAEPERWYLRGDMSLSVDLPLESETNQTMDSFDDFAGISLGKSSNGKFLQFAVDIKDGSDCSVSHSKWGLGSPLPILDPPCYDNHKDLEEDALNYESAPMDEDYFINGPIQADLWIATTAKDAVLSVRVGEVSPNGNRVKPITNGLLLASASTVDTTRSRYLNGEMIQPYHYFTKKKETEIVPGEAVKVQVEIFPTSALIRKGHRLRISISPSNQSQGLLNYAQREDVQGGVTTIYNSPEYPSSVVLPIVPNSALN